MTITDKYIELVKAVNEAATVEAHRDARSRLRGFGDAIAVRFGDAAHGHLITDADRHYMDQGIERPMCGGVWLDWEPTGEEVTP